MIASAASKVPRLRMLSILPWQADNVLNSEQMERMSLDRARGKAAVAASSPRIHEQVCESIGSPRSPRRGLARFPAWIAFGFYPGLGLVLCKQAPMWIWQLTMARVVIEPMCDVDL